MDQTTNIEDEITFIGAFDKNGKELPPSQIEGKIDKIKEEKENDETQQTSRDENADCNTDSGFDSGEKSTIECQDTTPTIGSPKHQSTPIITYRDGIRKAQTRLTTNEKIINNDKNKQTNENNINNETSTNENENIRETPKKNKRKAPNNETFLDNIREVHKKLQSGEITENRNYTNNIQTFTKRQDKIILEAIITAGDDTPLLGKLFWRNLKRQNWEYFTEIEDEIKLRSRAAALTRPKNRQWTFEILFHYSATSMQPYFKYEATEEEKQFHKQHKKNIKYFESIIRVLNYKLTNESEGTRIQNLYGEYDNTWIQEFEQPVVRRVSRRRIERRNRKK